MTDVLWFLILIASLTIWSAQLAARAARAELDRQRAHINRMLAQFDIEKWEAEMETGR